MVTEEKMKVSEAAKVLKINLSTAKFIVSSFKKKGRIMKKKSDTINEMIEVEKRKIAEELKKEYEVRLEKEKVELNHHLYYQQFPLPYGYLPY